MVEEEGGAGVVRECPGCLLELLDGKDDEEEETLRCGHGFHSRCLDLWLGGQVLREEG